MTSISTDVKFVNPVETDVKFLDTVDVRVDPLSGSYTIHTSIDKVPKLTLGVDPVHVALDSLPKITFGYDPIEVRLTALPSIRGHLPADFSVGFSVLGMELMCVRLCGEAQVITEPYRANPCEHCGAGARSALPVPRTTDALTVAPA